MRNVAASFPLESDNFFVDEATNKISLYKLRMFELAL